MTRRDDTVGLVSAPPFFIVGSGRSGTTMLRAILASHSRLCIPPETWFLNRMPDLLELARPLTPEEVERAIATMTGHYRWPDLGMDATLFREQARALKAPRLRDILELVYRAHLEREHKVRWGDKTPGYIALVPQLAKMFPGAPFIHFIRDGRDVARSFQARRWYGRWLHNNTREWNEAMEFDLRWSRSPFANQILQVRYEDLVLDTEGTVRRICKFLGEQFEPAMLSWQGRVDRLVPCREAHIHEKLKRAPDISDLYRWKKEMSAREILVCEAFMGSHLERHAYERKFRHVLWKPMFPLTRWYCGWVLPAAGYAAKAFRLLGARPGRPPKQAPDARDAA